MRLDDQRVRAAIGNHERGGSPACGTGQPLRALVQDRRHLGRVGKANRDDVDTVAERLPIDAGDDLEQAGDIRDRIDDHEEVHVGPRDELSVLREQWLKQPNEIGDRSGRDGHDLGDDLVARPRPVGERADDGRNRPHPGSFSANDLVHVAGLDRRESVHVEDGPKHVEQIASRDLADGANGHRPLNVRREEEIEADDLADRLNDGRDVRVVEVERHQTATACRRSRSLDVGRRVGARPAVVGRIRSGAPGGVRRLRRRDDRRWRRSTRWRRRCLGWRDRPRR